MTQAQVRHVSSEWRVVEVNGRFQVIRRADRLACAECESEAEAVEVCNDLQACEEAR